MGAVSSWTDPQGPIRDLPPPRSRLTLAGRDDGVDGP